MQGHFDVLAGLAIVRSSEHNSQILTAGTDGIVCMFDCQKKQPLWKYMLRVRVQFLFNVNMKFVSMRPSRK